MDALRHAIDSVLRPLLQAGDADIEIEEVSASRVAVVVTGAAATGLGAAEVRNYLITPWLRQHVGDGIAIEVRPKRDEG